MLDFPKLCDGNCHKSISDMSAVTERQTKIGVRAEAARQRSLARVRVLDVAHELAAANLPDVYRPEQLPDARPAFEVCFVTDDVQGAFDRAITEGAEAVTAPQTKPWGQHVAYVRDPDGNLIELASPAGGR